MPNNALDWKEKYLTLLDQQETLEAHFALQTDLLSKPVATACRARSAVHNDCYSGVVVVSIAEANASERRECLSGKRI